MMKISWAIVCCTVLCILSASVQAAENDDTMRQLDLFVSGTDGYHTFRIPALAVTQSGVVLAFAEGRRAGRSDTGDIDIVLKRSLDGGSLWHPLQVIWDDGENVCGNPCPVIDPATGTIYLLLTYNLGTDHEGEIKDGTSEQSRTVWIMSSTDDGESWSEPREITATTKKADWTWYATGPGVGIAMRSGRLVVPCDYALAGSKEYGSHVIVSDDGGKSWRLGGDVFPKCNECQVVELSDSRLLLNMRSYHGEHRRAIATSADGGLTWTAAKLDETLVEPVCQAGLLRCSWAENGGENRILFSNPASEKRENLTVRLSYDDCDTWPVSKTIHEGHAAYSCLGRLPDGRIVCLYERGDENAYEKITLATFGLGWLTDGVDDGR